MGMEKFTTCMTKWWCRLRENSERTDMDPSDYDMKFKVVNSSTILTILFLIRNNTGPCYTPTHT